MRQKAYALATVLILLGVVMFGSGAIVTISTLESKISRSQKEGVSAYYVAEAGVQHALWQLNTNTAYRSAMQAGNLNISYTANNQPVSGGGFSVSMVSTSAQHARINVTGTMNNGSFTAQRRIEIEVSQGAPANQTSIGQRAFFSGGSVSMNGNSNSFNMTNGGMYAAGSFTINSGVLNVSGGAIDVSGNYSKNNPASVNGTVHAANFPPAPTAVTMPSFGFGSYVGVNPSSPPNAKYSPSAFQTLVTNNYYIDLPGPVTVIDGNITLGNWAKNKAINITGLLIVNGSFGVSSSASGLSVMVNDPGNGKSGIFASGNTNISRGVWNMNGLFFSQGSVSLSGTQSWNINGAFLAGGGMNVNAGVVGNFNYVQSRVDATLGGTTTAGNGLEVEHWEEEY